MSYSGFDNENDLIKALNNQTINQLNDNLQSLLKSTFTNYNGNILCNKQAGKNKSDLEIIIGDEVHTFSVKKGTGNSVHQEPVNQFVDFLVKNYNISKELQNDILFFIWGDKTLDGSGNIKDRIGAREFVKLYPDIIDRLCVFFDSIKSDLINRFVINGVDSDLVSSEFIYYGGVGSGICCKADKALEWLCEHKSSGAIAVGRLSFQAWNRALNGGKSEHKRGQIQLKWATIKEDIEKISNE